MTTEPLATVDRERVTARLKSILSEMVGVAPDELSENSELFAQLGLDSTNALELLMTIEDEFGIEFDPGALEHRHLETVGTLATYLFDQAGL